MATVGIDYSRINDETPTYGLVRITYNVLKGERIFDSGDFVKDWYDCNKYIEFDLDRNKDPHVSDSSSVNHFIMDGAKFESAYLGFDKDDDPFLYYEYDGKGVEFFVLEGTTPTWEELRELASDPKKEDKPIKLTFNQKKVILSATSKFDYCVIGHRRTMQSLCDKGVARFTSGFGHKFGGIIELTKKGKEIYLTLIK